MMMEYKDFMEYLELEPYKASLWEKIQHKTKDIKYGIRRPYRAVKRFMQRGKRGWSDEDVWNADNYLAKIIADVLEWYASDRSTGVQMRYAYEDNRYDTRVEVMIERRNAEYLKHAARFRAFSTGDIWDDPKHIEEFGGVLAKDFDESIKWFAEIYQELWD